jgi:hypothetical protein
VARDLIALLTDSHHGSFELDIKVHLPDELPTSTVPRNCGARPPAASMRRTVKPISGILCPDG